MTLKIDSAAACGDATDVEPTKSQQTTAEKPQIVYKTKLGDPFHIVKLAKALRLSEKQASMLVSVLLTAVAVGAAILLVQPVRWLTEGLSPGAKLPHAPVPEASSLLQVPWRIFSKDLAAFTGNNVSLFIWSVIYYFLACLPGFTLDMCDFAWTRKYKIQPQAVPSMKDIVKSFKYDTGALLAMSVPGLSVMWFRQGPWPYYTGVERCMTGCRGEALFPDAAPPVAEFLFHLAACLAVFDFTFGVWHMLHHKSMPLYRHVHSMHHTYYMPFAFVTNYASMAELAVVSLLSVALPPAMGAHPLTQWVWSMVSIQLSVDAHTGYDLPGMLGSWFLGGPWILGLCGPRSHDRHHQRPRSNFFPFLGFWDRIFGTAWTDDEAAATQRKLE